MTARRSRVRALLAGAGSVLDVSGAGTSRAARQLRPPRQQPHTCRPVLVSGTTTYRCSICGQPCAGRWDPRVGPYWRTR